ncbi:MAG: hypothetical protein B6245_07535, partial [Desulfobacteraceae bacterium 4572_88]
WADIPPERKASSEPEEYFCRFRSYKVISETLEMVIFAIPCFYDGPGISVRCQAGNGVEANF